MTYRGLMQQSIDFIEQHLADDISLDKIAERAYLSKYHFHRIFKTTIGKTLMEYIRDRRLIRAAYELIGSSKTIGKIAIDLGFNSQDTFDKAFKRMYGITPKEYRRNATLRIIKHLSKGNQRMRETGFYHRIRCSEEEKKECLQVVDGIISLSKKQHGRGLLSLEAEINSEPHFLLQKGIQLMLSGTEPLVLREILGHYMDASKLSGKEFLSAVLIQEGLLAIQMGEYPWEIREKLIAFFGVDFVKEIREHFGVSNETTEQKIQDFLNRVKDKKLYSEVTNLLERPFQNFDKRSMQRILRELDIVILVTGMKGASGKTQIKIIESLPRKLVLDLIEAEEMFDIAELNLSQIIDAQNEILQAIKKLKVEGDIR